MRVFKEPLEQLGEFLEISSRLKKNKGILEVCGCIESQKIHFAESLSDGFRNKIIVTFSDLRAKEMCEDMQLLDQKAVLYPAKDFIFYNADIHGNLLVQQRMKAFKAVMEQEQVTLITTIDGFMDFVLPFEELKKNILQINLDSILELEALNRKLIHLGYERTAQVEQMGQFSIRGGIVDIYPLTEELPVRIELWDDEVDSIRSFDLENQRSVENLESVRIYPASELPLEKTVLEAGLERIRKEAKKQEESLRKQKKTEEANRVRTMAAELAEEIGEGVRINLDGFIRFFYQHPVSLLDYFEASDSIIFLDEPNRLMEKAQVVETEFRESMTSRLEKGYVLPSQIDVFYRYEEIFSRLSEKNTVSLSALEPRIAETYVTGKFFLSVKSITPYNNSFELLVEDLKRFKKQGYQVILLSASRTRAKRLAQDLQDFELATCYTEDLDRELQNGEIMVTHGSLHKGYEYPMIKFAVISESDIFGREKKKKRKHKVYEGRAIQSFSDLNIGDYVVHENNGLGIYRGIEKLEIDRTVKDYMKIEYADGGNLYILATQVDVIQKYAGSEAKQPKLNKLGSPEWKKTKSRVKTAVDEIAKDLVELYAKRQEKQGYVYGPDTVWQKEFEEMFPYEETEDQLLAIEAAKEDMESTKIMDRLICGDVGYGKTEIAIRTAFKAVQEGKQVVYLVPTTILAQQHYQNFSQRMKDFPVNVDLLCRFRTPSEQKRTIEGLKKGLVDIVIGTHRVLSKDISYKDLGLLIIDEEQRFGVTHKEKIKKLKENVDVLTLTATPIPRTLHMSLIGIRDMSVLEEPPMDRMPIQTFVTEYNEEMVREAIHRELSREGQVYYVYNRVNTIVEITNTVSKLVPEANVAFAHGQMKEHELEKIMYEFINGEIDVLVATTIIETGLDISNVNTIIIHDADQMGLSQLYQLRGRVGRSNRTAYAFLMYKRDKMLKETAEKRLQAIKEFTELGSGFKIAMRDLEIRGAGNLLGERQHGHMDAVGYDLYCKMLNEAVNEIKGVEPEKSFATAIEISIDAFIPERYIKNEYQKLDIYKRIASIENESECDDMLEELIDRFGEPPKPVLNLLEIAHVKILAHEVFVSLVSQKGPQLRLEMYEKAQVKAERIPIVLGKYGNDLKFTVDSRPFFTYEKKGQKKNAPFEVLEIVKKVLNDLKILLDQ